MYSDKWTNGKQPFVFAMGDPTGYGSHGDFIMGWEEDHLQRAVDTCTSDSGRVEDCPEFKLIPDTQAEGCSIAPKINEQTTGTLTQLPGCNPVQPGPNRASPVTSGCAAAPSIGAGDATFFKDLTSQGWGYVGCGQDNYYTRILTGANHAEDDMTNDKCVAFCASKGFNIAGSEYARECYCGNSIPDSGAPVPGVPGNCKMPCSGDSTQMCGGSGPISLYQKCSGDKCENASFGVKSAAAAGVVVPANAGSGASSALAAVASSPASSAMQMTPTNVASSPDSTTTTAAVSAVESSYPATNVPVPSTATSLPASWTYKGCYTDTLTPRSLPQWSTFNGPEMSNAACIAFCDDKGFSMAGTEYAGQCFCGNDISSSKVGEGECDMPCTGGKGEMCGGGGTLSVYSKSGTGVGGMKKRGSSVVRGLKGHGGHGKRKVGDS